MPPRKPYKKRDRDAARSNLLPGEEDDERESRSRSRSPLIQLKKKHSFQEPPPINLVATQLNPKLNGTYNSQQNNQHKPPASVVQQKPVSEQISINPNTPPTSFVSSGGSSGNNSNVSPSNQNMGNMSQK